jgi:hypothetical protein
MTLDAFAVTGATHDSISVQSGSIGTPRRVRSQEAHLTIESGAPDTFPARHSIAAGAGSEIVERVST